MIDVKVGDTVIVHGYHRAKEATVTKVGRVWVFVGEGPSMQKFRLDDQTDGSGYSQRDRFYTLDQWAEKQRRDGAADVLRKHGIDLRPDSLWRGREIELANLLRSAVEG